MNDNPPYLNSVLEPYVGEHSSVWITCGLCNDGFSNDDSSDERQLASEARDAGWRVLGSEELFELGESVVCPSCLKAAKVKRILIAIAKAQGGAS